MNAERLADLVRQRKSVLERLLEISQRQIEAVRQGRMNELMSLLAEKQTPLASLRELSQWLAAASTDDPDGRIWDQADQRIQCQQEHQQCEVMLKKLMTIEAECEHALAAGREKLRQELHQSQTAQQAVSGYSEVEQPATSGGRLDLSSQ